MADRSKRKKELDSLVDKTKQYPIAEAVELVKKTSKTKFDGGVELHIRLGIDAKQADQIVRGTIVLPHGTGKTKRVVVFAEGKFADEAQKAGAYKVGGQELVKEIGQSGKFDGDIAIAHPTMMKFLGTIAKILGPKGLMPNPKNETVTDHVGKTVGELAKGKITFRNDTNGNVHLLIGKASFESKQLQENIEVSLDAIRRAKPSSSKGVYLQTVTINATMGPGIPLTVS